MNQKVIRPAASGTDNQVFRTDTQSTAVRACITCGEVMPLTRFAKDCWKPQGRRSVCAVCRAAYDRERDYIRRCRSYGNHPAVEHFTTAQLVERHGDGCYHCDIGAFECVDHLVCVRVGGPHTLANAVPCCRKCNQRKRWELDEHNIKVYRHLFEAAA